MKNALILALLLIGSSATLAQKTIKQPKFRIDAGPVVSCLGYYAMMDMAGSTAGYFGLLSKMQLSAKISRKNECYFSFEHKKRDINTTKVNFQAIGNSMITSDVNHNTVFNFFGFGIRHFLRANNSPIGNYLGLGITIAKIQSDGFGYTYTSNGQSGIPGYVSRVDETIPHLTVSHGKRIMLNKTVYFSREISYSFNPLFFYDFNYPNFLEMCQYNSMQLTNFQYTISIGALF